MRFFIIAACLAVTAGSAPASTPIAEVLCAPTSEMTQKLSLQFGERPMAWGTRGPEQIMQVWTADDGDWTLVVRYATGTSCIVAMGENWASGRAENPA